jgi:endonuclease YncB( thermonuclease family)
LPTVVHIRNRPVRKTRARRTRLSPFNALWIVIVAALWGFIQFSDRPLLSLPKLGEDALVVRHFTICDGPRRDGCVIDGDTFRFQGQRIRIADIDAPETHPSRCAFEARLGEQATRRLQELLNEGPFALRQSGFRDEDRYGRKLRTVVRDGRSLGAILVSEGLARGWTGRRLPWCT